MDSMQPMTSPRYQNRPLTIVSNDNPYHVQEKFGRLSYDKNSGGLVSVLDEMMRRTGGTWISSGEKDNFPEEVGVPLDNPKYSLRLVSLTDLEVKNYQGFSNRVLWPLSHYFLDRCHFRNDYWKAYESVNEKFSHAFQTVPKDPDLVWIHDFHLTLLAGMLRQQSKSVSIGFFWHIPFPAPPVFRVLPWRKEILHGLLACDLIGFHLPLHARHFLECVSDVVGVPVDRARGSIKYDGRTIRVGAFPVGIDFRGWNELAASPAIQQKAQQIRSEAGVERILLGVDRLDYTKGIHERLLAYERFLNAYPEFHGKVCLIQVAAPSGGIVEEYRLLRREIDESIGRIAARFSTRKWVPLRYLYRAFPAEEIAAYYSAADVALVTPLRDGMNLVAKEYVASRIREDGTLILSEFTGAAGTLNDATLVNPYDTDGLAQTIRATLTAPEAAQRSRMRRLREAVRERDVHWWCDSFLKSLATEKEERDPQTAFL
jgi:trehalose 6-phosphate synthase